MCVFWWAVVNALGIIAYLNYRAMLRLADIGLRVGYEMMRLSSQSKERTQLAPTVRREASVELYLEVNASTAIRTDKAAKLIEAYG